MQDQSDAQLLSAYARHGDEPAFRVLVTRHADLVYSAAFRQVGSAAAADVAQSVFTDLARKAQPVADKLAPAGSLAGWLYRSTRFAALKHLRAHRHQADREKEAMQQLIINTDTARDWEAIRPALDEAMADLAEDDREALLLRYFKNLDFRAVGQSLGVSDDTAQKRVSRALEKLRGIFARRGLTTTTGALAAVLAAHAVQAAPAGLALTLTTASLAAATVTTVGTLATGTVTATNALAMTTLQKAVLTATLVLGVATPLVLHQSHAGLRYENQALRRQLDQLPALRAEHERLARLATPGTPATLAPDKLADLARLRGEVGTLRQQTNELARLQVENQQLRAGTQSVARARPNVPPGPGAEPVLRESWSFVGLSTPETAFQSAIWALSQGEARHYLATLTPDADEHRKFAGKSEAEISAELLAEGKSDFKGITAYRILDKEAVSPDEVVLTITAIGQDETARFKLQRVGSEWRFGGPIRDRAENK